MKKETFISKWIDKDGHMVYFENWGCKRVSTVIRNCYKLWGRPFPFDSYRRSLEKDGATGEVAVYKLIDGIRENSVYVGTWNVNLHY